MDGWVKKRLDSTVFHGTERRSKYLTFSEINKVLVPVVNPDGTYADPGGAKLPLKRASLDRINPRVGYELDNIRIIDVGLNRIKGNYVNDAAIIAYLKQLAASSKIPGSNGRRKHLVSGHCPLSFVSSVRVSHDASHRAQAHGLGPCYHSVSARVTRRRETSERPATPHHEPDT